MRAELVAAATGLVLAVHCGSADELNGPLAPHVSGSGGNPDGEGNPGARGGDSGSGGTSGITGGPDSAAAAGGGGGTAGTGGGGGTAGTGGLDASLDGDRDVSAGGSMGAPDGSADAGTILVDRCPGPLDPTTAAALRAGGSSDGTMKWLYPYDRTLFPRGILPPVLQWAPRGGASVEAALVRLRAQGFEYRECFGPTSPARIPIPGDVWISASSAGSGPDEPVIVELTTLARGVVSGPITQSWIIAPASLPGFVYYTTYNARSAGNIALMRLRPGATQADVYLTVQGIPPLGPCVSCHSVSANGTRMVAARHTYPMGPYESSSYDLSGSGLNPPVVRAGLDEAGLAALLPDGSRFLTMGSPGTTQTNPFPNGPGNVPGMTGPRISRLFGTATGQPIQTEGWTVQYAKMPAFSRDGRQLVFNHHDAGQGHTLATMDFDPGTNTFSNLVEIYRHSVLWPGWPAFTPDGQGVVFALGDAPDYVSAHPARPVTAQSDLYYVDLPTRRAVLLSRAGGFDQGTSYLPYPGRDERREFFPAVAPTAAGGYAWLFFTSRRNYGNTTVTSSVEDPSTKSLWVAALDLDPAPGEDPSHPAFYLDGQELGTGNFRPVPALEP